MSRDISIEHRRLKYAATINDESLPETTGSDYELKYVDIGNVDSYGTLHDVVTYQFEDAPSRARRIARHGDVIISTVRTYLQAIAPIEKPPENLIVSTGFAVVRPDSKLFDPGFCKFALRESSFLWEVENRSTGVSYPAINASDLADIRIHLPSLNLQCQIADYLDRETARIDALVAEKERMLALLKEKRAALISRAVTRGLNPDTPLKPSGVDWLGDIPAHWEVMPIKYVATVGNGSTPAVDNVDYWDEDGFPWLNSSVVNADYVKEPSRHVTAKALTECHLPTINPPAVLVGITGQGKTRGMASILTIEATINQHLAFVEPRGERITAEYLRYVLVRAYSFLRSDSDGSGSTKGAITCEQLANFRITLPPENEQVHIVRRIQEGKHVMDRLQQELNSSVRLLKERRAALITAAVIGQINFSPDSKNCRRIENKAIEVNGDSPC